MDCLNGLVGIKGGCGGDEEGDIFLNDLPSVTIEAANATINSEYESGFELLRSKRSFAIQAIKGDLRSHLAANIKLDSLIDSDIIGYYKNDLVSYPLEANKYKGIQLRIDDLSHAELLIQSLQFQGQYTGDLLIYVFDLITGKELEVITFPVVADEISTLTINKSYPLFNRRQNLLFCFESSIDSYETTVRAGKAHCCGTYANYWRCNKYVNTRAVKIDTSVSKIQSLCEVIPTTGGLSIQYSLTCSAEPLICQLRQALAMPLLYKTGMEIMLEMENSKRLNSIISLYGKSHTELKDYFEIQYISLMESLIKNMRIPNDTCYNCRPRTKSVTVIP